MKIPNIEAKINQNASMYTIATWPISVKTMNKIPKIIFRIPSIINHPLETPTKDLVKRLKNNSAIPLKMKKIPNNQVMTAKFFIGKLTLKIPINENNKPMITLDHLM